MSEDNNIHSLSDRLKAKAEDELIYSATMSAKSSAHGEILAPAVQKMRELGLSSTEIAKTLRFVADVLDGKQP